VNARIKPPPVLRLLLLAAFVVQCVFVQTHIHFARLSDQTGLSASYQAGGQAEKLTSGGSAAKSDYCPLCWEAAMAGHFVMPAVNVFPPPPAVILWLALPAMAEFGLRPFSHGWLSRAPPQ
jgi:hypothetical protein